MNKILYLLNQSRNKSETCSRSTKLTKKVNSMTVIQISKISIAHYKAKRIPNICRYHKRRYSYSKIGL